MSHTQQKVSLAIALFAPFATAFCADYEVYYWVDANGVANYSQMAPPDTTAGVSKQVLPDAVNTAPEAGEDIYAVEATTREMDALWKGIEDRRKEQRKRQPAPVVVVQQSQPEEYGFPVWYKRPGRDQNHRPGYGRPGGDAGNAPGKGPANGPGNGSGQGPNPLPPIMRLPSDSLLDSQN
jgi:hypothetical protein